MNLYPGDPAALLLARLLLAVSIVFAAALIAAICFRKNHSARHSILLSALLCSLLLPGIAIGFWETGASLVSLPWLPAKTPMVDTRPIGSPDAGERSSSAAISFDETTPRISIERNGKASKDSPPDADVAVFSDSQTQATEWPILASASGPGFWRQAVGWGILVWAGGSLLLLAMVLSSSVRLSQLARRSAAGGSPRLNRIVDRLQDSLRLSKAPCIRFSDRLPGPLAFGVIRPMILLPTRLLEQLSDDQLFDVLAHESAHITRRDPLILFLQRIARALYWPIPLVHVLNHELSQAREELCDSQVLAHRDPIRYGETLLRVAELVCLARPVRGANTMLTRGGLLERRIANLLDHRRNNMRPLSRRRRVLGFLVLLLAGFVACGVRIVSAEVPPEGRSADALPEPFPVSQFALAQEKGKEEISKKGAHRVIFKPMHGMEKDSSWTALSSFPMEYKQRYEQMMARLTLLGEVPIQRKGDKEPIFKIKLLAGSADSLNVRLTGPDNMPHDRILHRDQPLAWKIHGRTYRIVYPTSEVAADQPAESHFAFVFVTCRPDDKDNKTSDKVLPPETSTDNSQGDGGSDLLRNIRTASAPILKELAEKHGYGLADGQSVRHVPLPFSDLRTTYYKVGHPSQSERIKEPPQTMLFHWTDGRLQNWGMTFGADQGKSLQGILTGATEFSSQEIELSEELREKRIAGDWVVRPGAPAETILRDLEAILRKELSIPLRLEIKTVKRPVYAARGTYKLTPLEGEKAQGRLHLTDKTITTDRVQIFANAIVPDSGAGGGTGDLDEFLKALGRWIKTPIINEVEKGPANEISYRYHERSPFTDQMQKEDHDAQAVLGNITRQTGLTFTKEDREVKILFATRGE